MKREIRIPIGRDGELIEYVSVVVRQTFNIEVAGVEEVFCIHAAYGVPENLVITHLPTGGRIYEFNNTMPVEEGKKKAVERLKSEAKKHGDWYLIMKMSAMPVINQVDDGRP